MGDRNLRIIYKLGRGGMEISPDNITLGGAQELGRIEIIKSQPWKFLNDF